ncbi:TIGR04255 family protein [Rhodobacter sp. KR11]|uniref:TIGR04255 family protein n=1 Tax=Rhodobacter sp. KR11 TaxID=2974588 RepID=UPI002221845C|nr:TIGR04255 family protein [Rhodobacter sp. KR11]MCW1919973.1 TIGR04255 family protein [Rhodobacter sp. KR11]
MDRVIYDHNPLFEVVAQLQFPTILSIGVDIPAKFQELVRRSFPLVEIKHAINVNVDVALGEAKSHSKTFYEFLSEDKAFKIVLGDDFIALSTSQYRHWEDFSNQLKLAIDALGAVYDVQFFTRIGLRYVDIIDRAHLNLKEIPWAELLRPSLLGILSEEFGADDQIKIESMVTNFSLDGGNVKCTFNCGLPNPDILNDDQRKSAENGNLIVLDTDFFSPEGNTNAADAFSSLATYNKCTRNAFRWAIKEHLHKALGPQAPK